MNKLYFLKKLNLNLTEDEKATVIHDINVTNFSRMKLILIIFIEADKFQIQITASFGISLLKDNFSDSFDSSFKVADVALYKAKNQGRNQIVIASEHLNHTY